MIVSCVQQKSAYYMAKVKRRKIRFFLGSSQEDGLLPSQNCEDRTKAVEDVLKLEEMFVKVIEIKQGRVNLSRKVAS